ncbi:MAG: DNA mismatch repair protein MutS, partial [Limisphaerales bacterium]
MCDQMEDARPGQLVKREVTQIISPGTHFDERLLAAERNNFLAALFAAGKTFGLAFADLTTGDFLATEVEGETAVLTELHRLRPAEIIYPGEAESLRELLKGRETARSFAPTDQKPATGLAARPGEANPASRVGAILSGYDDWVFAPETALFTVREHFKVASLDGFGLKDKTAATGAAGAILHYLTQHLRRDAASLTRLSFYQRSDYMALDLTTLRHLEILDPLHHDASRNASVYGALNRTVTPMGARRLREWLSQPLGTVGPIQKRQAAVQALVENAGAMDALRAQLGQVRDLERTIGRLTVGTGNARDLAALRIALEQVPALKQVLSEILTAASRLNDDNIRSGVGAGSDFLAGSHAGIESEVSENSGLLPDLQARVTEMPDLVELIGRSIVDEPPLALKEGGLIRDGFDQGLDDLRGATRGGKDWIAKLQQDEITRTGIQSLKVRFNSVFGYYIEVTRANLDKVPPQYVRKQTIANGERFITQELKEMEGKILGAEERSVKLEYELFQRVREQVLGRLAEIQETAAALAQLDVLASFAETARLYSYCRPEVRDEGVLWIRDGRHPVIEQTGEERFVPNDTSLRSSLSLSNDGHRDDGSVAPAAPATDRGRNAVTLGAAMNGAGPLPEKSEPQIMLITGPNMAGKSTYIRQVALLTLLAHTGSFIPAAEARIDLVDRIFTRIGASDDLARGQSTFMVEMCETANILN